MNSHSSLAIRIRLPKPNPHLRRPETWSKHLQRTMSKVSNLPCKWGFEAIQEHQQGYNQSIVQETETSVLLGYKPISSEDMHHRTPSDNPKPWIPQHKMMKTTQTLINKKTFWWMNNNINHCLEKSDSYCESFKGIKNCRIFFIFLVKMKKYF